HQGFAGINHKINVVKDLKKQDEDSASLMEKLSDYFGDMFDKAKNKVVSDVFPLGHGAALTCPDMPFLKWEYENEEGETIKRDNTDIFMAAVERIHKAMVCYQMKNPGYELTAADRIPKQDLEKIKENFLTFEDEDGEDRHRKWLDSIANGEFGFAERGREVLSYIPKGMGSWKHKALDTKREVETKIELFRFTPEFMDTDWKLFHDALQIHRIDITRKILPDYGICVA
ncbi:MAG: hypothetical protein KJ668_08765, partial [Proteobacteria bacterium]|nr:hypothetical protein [Pseudomonadota bacterium]